MIESILAQFAGSGEASTLLSQLQQQGLSPQQAQCALSATAEGAAQEARSGGLAGLLGGSGGVAGALGGLLGGGAKRDGDTGGGLGGALGGALGGMLGGAKGGADVATAERPGATGATAPGGLPAGVIDSVTRHVATKTGLAPEMARTAVNLVLPRVVAFAKSRLTGA
ncbi:MAG: hypothetical protein ACK4YP_22905 [Myxococcota bacterium]